MRKCAVHGCRLGAGMLVNNVPLCLGHSVAARGRLVRRGLTLSSFKGDVLQLLKEPFTPDSPPDGSGPTSRAESQPALPTAATAEAPLEAETVDSRPPAEPQPPPQPPLEADMEAALATLAANPAFAKV